MLWWVVQLENESVLWMLRFLRKAFEIWKSPVRKVDGLGTWLIQQMPLSSMSQRPWHLVLSAVTALRGHGDRQEEVGVRGAPLESRIPASLLRPVKSHSQWKI